MAAVEGEGGAAGTDVVDAAGVPEGERLSWQDQLPDKYKNDKRLFGKQMGQVVEDYLDGEKFTPPELPKDAGEYKIKTTGFDDPTFDAAFAQMAFDSKLTVDQATAAHGILQKSLDGQSDKLKVVRAETDANFRKEWGDDYEKNRRLVAIGAKAVGGDIAVKFFTEAGLGPLDQMINTFHKIGKLVDEGTIGTKADVGGKTSPAQAPGTFTYESHKDLKRT